MSTEPVGIGGLVSVLAVAIVGALVAFGVPLSDGQTGALLAVVAAVIGLVTYLQRAKVTPVGGIGSDNSGDDAAPYQSSPEGLDADDDGTPDTRP